MMSKCIRGTDVLFLLFYVKGFVTYRSQLSRCLWNWRVASIFSQVKPQWFEYGVESLIVVFA